jgi:glycosyltransferase involved in cell wall biosynthesis
LLPDVGVLGLVPDPWNLVLQPRQQVLLRLARYFHVVWIDPPRGWRWWRRRDSGRLVPGPAPVEGGDRFVVHRPWLPLFHRPSRLARRMLALRVNRARAILVRRRCTAILVYLWRPQFAAVLDRVPFSKSLYHIDDEYSFSEDEVPPNEQELRLIGAVDQVFVASRGLLARKGGINPNTAFVPNGVDFHAYAAPAPEPAELATIPRPRIGYTGVVKPRLDWSLLDRLTAARPDWSFVFVGPIQREAATLEAVATLGRRANVHFLGFKPAPALAGYPQHFDVCIMPYRVNHYTNQIYPLKLHEYLASGQPTVGTPIATLTAFAEVVTLARGAPAWVEAIERALAPASTTAEKRARRQRVAQDYDWELIVQTIARTMAERLGPAWVSRLDRALDEQEALAGPGGARPIPVVRRGPHR